MPPASAVDVPCCDSRAVDRFEQVWPAVQRRLLSTLRKRGATRELAEDIAQEVALRCVAHGVPYADVEDLLRWCNTTATNLLVDHHRTSRRIVDVSPPESASDDDVFRIVDSRLALRATFEAIGQLEAIDRRALIDVLHEVAPTPGDRRESTMLAVRRNRARGRLRALLAAAMGWLIASGRALRRSVGLSAASVAAVLPLLVVVAPFAAEPGRGPAPLQPRVEWLPPSAQVASMETAVGPTGAVATSAGRPGAAPPAPRQAARPLPDATVGAPDGQVGVHARSKDEPRSGAALLCVRPDLPGADEVCTPQGANAEAAAG